MLARVCRFCGVFRGVRHLQIAILCYTDGEVNGTKVSGYSSFALLNCKIYNNVQLIIVPLPVCKISFQVKTLFLSCLIHDISTTQHRPDKCNFRNMEH